MKTPELKPCPFCGSAAQLSSTMIAFQYVRCSNNACAVKISSYKNQDAAIKQWNTRHDIHAAVVAERDELRKTIKEMSLLHGYDDGALSDSPFDQLRSIKSALLERDELRRDNAAALRLVADLRFALGDDGQRMQPELIEYAKQLRAEVERLNKLAAAISKDCNETALQRNAAQDEVMQLRAKVERLKSVVDWRAYQAQFARGQSAPDNLETARAAWARDQELILDQREEIAALKIKLNQSGQKSDRLRARLNAACEWVPVAEADLPHVAIDLALLLRDGSWIQGDHDHGAFRSAMGRDVTYEVTHIMRIKPQSALGE